MRAPSLAAITVALIAGSLLVLIAIGGRPREQAASPPAAVAPPSSASANGFTLTSSSVDLPPDEASFPAGPNVDLVNQRCLACHSASMVLTQPALKPEQWKAIVEKMRDVYRAPVTEAEVPAIVDYLSRRGTAAAGRAD